MRMMHGTVGEPKNKEQFKLLNFSDDSKSLSDLELTEIVVPRKRKVRRKTKPKNGHRSNRQTTSKNSTPCNTVGLWVAVTTNICWLLILSYVVSTVHSQFEAMEKRQTQLTESIKTISDEFLDKAHSLEEKQSTLIKKLFDLQNITKNSTEDVLQLRSVVQQQQTVVGDLATFSNLGKNVADFGSQLASFKLDIETLKERGAAVTSALGEQNRTLDGLKKTIDQTQKNQSNTVEDTVLRHELDDIRNHTAMLASDLEKVNGTFNQFAALEQQKVDDIEKNHTRKLNDLTESVARITSQDVNQAMQNYQEEMKRIQEQLTKMQSQLEALKQAALPQTAAKPSDDVVAAKTADGDKKTKDAAAATPPVM